MANEPWKNFEVPTQMRQLAEQSVEQARKAVDGFMTAAQKAVTTAESQAATAQSNAKDVGAKAMSFAEQNIANSFDFAQKLVRAKDIQEVMTLQQEYPAEPDEGDVGAGEGPRVSGQQGRDGGLQAQILRFSFYLNTLRRQLVLCIAIFVLHCTIRSTIFRSSGVICGSW